MDPAFTGLPVTWTGLPPLHMSVGDDEAMRDDTTRFAAKASAAGVDIILRMAEEICAFIKQYTDSRLPTSKSRNGYQGRLLRIWL